MLTNTSHHAVTVRETAPDLLLSFLGDKCVGFLEQVFIELAADSFKAGVQTHLLRHVHNFSVPGHRPFAAHFRRRMLAFRAFGRLLGQDICQLDTKHQYLPTKASGSAQLQPV